MVVHIKSEEETLEYARELGRNAHRGQIYCLDGDLGAGKTTFTKGFSEGLGVESNIDSPTFNILKIHDVKKQSSNINKLYHFDVYRIEDVREMEEVGYEDYFYGDGVTVVEWAEMIRDIIPQNAIWIYISKSLENDNYRTIEMRDTSKS